MISTSDIRSFFRGTLKLNEQLGKYTTMGLGGPADVYAEPLSKEDAANLMCYLLQHGVPFVIMGYRSNFLVSDLGYRGVAVNLEANVCRVREEDGLIHADAGARLGKLIDYCVECSFSGLEDFAGRPGTVGGSVLRNFEAGGVSIRKHLAEVDVLRNCSIVTIKDYGQGFVFNRDGQERDIILSVRFALRQGEKEQLIRLRREHLMRYNLLHPINVLNAGHVFKDPDGYTAAQLIERAGLTGMTTGKVAVSDSHGNYVVNKGGARARDVLSLITLMRRAVHQRFGINLDTEIRLLGFESTTEKAVV